MNEPNAGRLGPDKAIRSMAILAAGGHCGHSDVVDDEGQAKACIPSPSRHNAKGAPGLNACHFCHHQRSVCDLNPSKREAMPSQKARDGTAQAQAYVLPHYQSLSWSKLSIVLHLKASSVLEYQSCVLLL